MAPLIGTEVVKSVFLGLFIQLCKGEENWLLKSRVVSFFKTTCFCFSEKHLLKIQFFSNRSALPRAKSLRRQLRRLCVRRGKRTYRKRLGKTIVKTQKRPLRRLTFFFFVFSCRSSWTCAKTAFGACGRLAQRCSCPFLASYPYPTAITGKLFGPGKFSTV